VTRGQPCCGRALGGNLLIEDAKDIFMFPHDVARYVNYVWFDFMTGVGTPIPGAPANAGDPALGSGGLEQRGTPRGAGQRSLEGR